MKSGTKTKILAAFILAATATTALAQHQGSHFCSIDTVKIKKNHLRTALVTQGINLGLWTYDRHISGSEFAKINIKTVRSNMETGFVWDSDRLATNHLGHPLNGGFYHTAARANGLTYWEALPYSIAGSLVWEVFAEKEPPGLNDFIATPLAGAAFGEVSHRISGLILDNSATGAGRVGRELAAFVVNPIGSVNRLFTGQSWKVREEQTIPIPVSMEVSSGLRYVADGGVLSGGGTTPYLRFGMEYGYRADAAWDAPFDYFRLGFTMNPMGDNVSQPLFGRVDITGRIWGSDIDTGSQSTDALWGIFQQYDYYHYRPGKEGGANSLFNFSETVAAGVGLVLEHRGSKAALTQDLFADLIVLGAVQNKNLFIIERHYNMGSGLAVKSRTSLRLLDRISLSLDMKVFYLNTWKDKDYRLLEEDTHPLYYNTPGDKSRSLAYVLEPSVRIDITRHWGVYASAARLALDSIFTHFPTDKARTTDILLGLCYNL